jgi:pimeloyl-ACP methyl ester carboxylesterase
MTEVPRFSEDQLGSMTPQALDGRPFVVAGVLDVDCRLKLHAGSDTLFVVLNGAVDRKKHVLPVFARWNWGKVLGGHVLSICDPTLRLDAELRLGWFLGTRDANPFPTLTRVVGWAESNLGIAPDKVVFYGSSGGGFASILAAAQRPVGRVVAINPQTDIVAYYPPAVKRVARVFSPGLPATAARDAHPQRWSAIEAAEAARKAGRDLRTLYDHHFLPWCQRFGLPAAGGSSEDGTMLTYLYDSPDGHAAEPPEVVKYITSTGLPALNG